MAAGYDDPKCIDVLHANSIELEAFLFYPGAPVPRVKPIQWGRIDQCLIHTKFILNIDVPIIFKQLHMASTTMSFSSVLKTV